MKNNRILVVDDDNDFRDLVTDYLEEEGFSAIQAGNGSVAFKHIEREKPDLILLDIQMPEVNGLDICRALKKQSATWDIPVIIISASASASDKLSAYLAGAWLYLEKTFALDELGEYIRIALNRNEISVSDSVFSLSSRRGLNNVKYSLYGALGKPAEEPYI